MRPSLNEARYKAALDLLEEVTDRERSDLFDEIDERAEEIRSYD